MSIKNTFYNKKEKFHHNNDGILLYENINKTIFISLRTIFM